MNLNATKLCMIVLAGIYLIISVGYATNGEYVKAGIMLGCGMLFIINLARYIDAGA